MNQLFLVLLFTTALFGNSLSKGCHDFSKKIVTPIREPIPLLPNKDNFESGVFDNGLDWGAGRGAVKKSIKTLYQTLLDHYFWKPKKKHELQTTVEPKEGYLQYHKILDKVSISLVFFSTSVSWTEEWGYALADGTEDKPNQIVISYQKVSGTDYLKHLCGTVMLTAMDADTTDVYSYQQIKASHQSHEDVMNLNKSLLKELRE